MPRRMSLDAVVLRAVDVGEADRFCILLTREKGRMAARAKAVRKPGSRMGGSLLPMRRVKVDIVENGEHHLIVGAADHGAYETETGSFASFFQRSSGMDLILSLIEDSEPLPAVFDLLCAFLHHSSHDGAGALTAFQTRLFHLLGLLPTENGDDRIMELSDSLRAFLHASASPLPFDTLAELAPAYHELATLLDGIIDEHAARPMKSRALALQA